MIVRRCGAGVSTKGEGGSIRPSNPDLRTDDRLIHARQTASERSVIIIRIQQGHDRMFWRREFAEAGGLMAYGLSTVAMFRHAATLVDKILKGAKPADVPVERVMTFELVINLKTAEALGLTIPPSVLFQATEVFR
jgi:putative tryptophan/tyrosine transport system substrate-binding protein